MATKTNAARALERLKIAYTLLTYDVGKEHLSASDVAASVGLDPAHVFKTLLARCDGVGPVFAIVPAPGELDLKALARLAGARRAALVPLAEVEPLTGYVRGGTTALAAKKVFPTFLHDSALELGMMVISAGRRGLQLRLSPQDYVRATRATVGPLTRRDVDRA